MVINYNVELARLECNAYRVDYNPISGTPNEICRFMKRHFDVNSWMDWTNSNGIKVEFKFYRIFSERKIIYSMIALMTREQAVYFKLVYGTKVVYIT